MHATLNDVVHDQRTAVGGALNDVVHDQRTAVGGAVPKDINGSVFFSARKSSLSKQKLGFSRIEIISIASSKNVFILVLFTRGVHGG